MTWGGARQGQERGVSLGRIQGIRTTTAAHLASWMKVHLQAVIHIVFHLVWLILASPGCSSHRLLFPKRAQDLERQR